MINLLVNGLNCNDPKSQVSESPIQLRILAEAVEVILRKNTISCHSTLKAILHLMDLLHRHQLEMGLLGQIHVVVKGEIALEAGGVPEYCHLPVPFPNEQKCGFANNMNGVSSHPIVESNQQRCSKSVTLSGNH